MLEVMILGNQFILTDGLTDFCSIGWVRLATMLLQYFLPGASLLSRYEKLAIGSVLSVHAYTVESSSSKSCTASCCKDMKFVKASHGVRDESLAEAFAPEPDFDPRDPADQSWNEDAKDTLLRSLKFGHRSSGLEQFWVPLQHPITMSTEKDTAGQS